MALSQIIMSAFETVRKRINLYMAFVLDKHFDQRYASRCGYLCNNLHSSFEINSSCLVRSTVIIYLTFVEIS